MISSSLVTLLLLVLPALLHGQDYDDYEVDPNAIEGLPASAADLLDAPYDDGFNCDQQDAGYGYYADVNNGCKVGNSDTIEELSDAGDSSIDDKDYLIIVITTVNITTFLNSLVTTIKISKFKLQTT